MNVDDQKTITMIYSTKSSVLTYFSALVLLALWVGCSPAKDGATESSSSGKTTIAAIPKATGGDFWETVEAGARRAADELDVDLKREGTVTETEIAEQTKIIENMINLGVDAIALAPLNSGKVGGYGTDILDVEPPPADHVLLSAKNCIVTPHIGSRTHESVQRQAGMATRNLLTFFAGQPAEAQANKAPWPGNNSN